jgi:hypothetical protein
VDQPRSHDGKPNGGSQATEQTIPRIANWLAIIASPATKVAAGVKVIVMHPSLSKVGHSKNH